MRFSVPTELSKYAAIGGEKGTTLFSRTIGDAAIIVKQLGDPYNETVFVPVSVGFYCT